MTPTSSGQIPLLYAADLGHDDICMYLSLRSNDLNSENDEGKTVFITYMLRRDFLRMK